MAHRDPGVHNWLDTQGFERGNLTYRHMLEGEPAVLTPAWSSTTSSARAARRTPRWSAPPNAAAAMWAAISRHPAPLRPLVSEVVTDISDDELAGLSEFALLPENAEQAGVTRSAARGASASKHAAADQRAAAGAPPPPRIVFLHGGGQNAHTWDTVIVGLGEPALAVDLPGHGHSAWREDGDYSPQNNAAALAPVLRTSRRTPN